MLLYVDILLVVRHLDINPDIIITSFQFILKPRIVPLYICTKGMLAPKYMNVVLISQKKHFKFILQGLHKILALAFTWIHSILEIGNRFESYVNRGDSKATAQI